MIKHIVILLICLSFAEAVAGETLYINSDEQFGFAAAYFSSREYGKAIAEYERFIHFFPEDERVEIAMYQIGKAHQESGQFQEAVRSFRRLIEAYPKSRMATDAYFALSESYAKAKESDLAISVLGQLALVSERQDVRDKALYQIGWLHIGQASWQKARLSFQQISESRREIYQVNQIYSGLERSSEIKQKSPALAGWLSVIPGAGFLYCERYQDALTAFLLNTGLILAAYESFKDENYALGSVIGLVEVGFYSGNIYGAITSAHKYNKAQTAGFIENLKNNTRIGISGDADNGIKISLQIDYFF